MSFNQSAIARATIQTQRIFNNYVYRTTDTIDQVKSAGYFDQCRFAQEDGPSTNGFGWNGGNIECYCSDGYVVGQMNADTGTMAILFTGPIVISETNVLVSSSTTNQVPGALGTPLQVSFGPLQSTDAFDLSAAGDITCKINGRYQFTFTAQAGRVGGAGIVNLFLRLLKNGVQIGNVSLARLDNAATIVPLRFPFPIDLVATDVISAFVVQDASGIAGSGGLYSVTPVTAGWGPSPSAAVVVSQIVTVV